MKGTKHQVLDKGYIILRDYMGSDLTVVNAARASYLKSKEELDERDISLISFLGKENHSSPFRHVFLQFEVHAPLEVARQWWKHVVGSQFTMDAWNEASRRYVTLEPEFYVPDPHQWRSAPENKKQGSAEPVDIDDGIWATTTLTTLVGIATEWYEEALRRGIAPEMARLFLPAYAMYTTFYWSCSLQAACHFVKLRRGEGAQKEIGEYAKVIEEWVRELFPHSAVALLGDGKPCT